jgi:anti-sigma regulatory factor (Ser/Thr protein kinase)
MRVRFAGDVSVGSYLKLELPSDPRLLCVVRSAVNQLARVVGFSEEDCRGITVAVDEAMTNIIRHAYQNRPDQPIELVCQSTGDGIEFLLTDHGKSTNPSKLRGRPLHEVRPGGLGTHIIRQVMDRVEYKALPNQNCLRLAKHLKPPRTIPDER